MALAGQDAHYGFVSEWMDFQNGLDGLVGIANPGDLIEFERNGYRHWAVYLGLIPVDDGVDEEINDDILRIEYYVVHRANPPDAFRRSYSFPMNLSQSVSKGATGVGNVCMEPLADVWNYGTRRARINNSFDHKMAPFAPDEVVQRVKSAVFDHNAEGHLNRCYNLVTNNCEHFATWARNGWAISDQVSNYLMKALKAGAYLATAALPRPIAIVVGAGMAAYQATSNTP